MPKKVIEASMAVAIAVKLCRPKVIPMYPITPQTHIVERLADFINDGEMKAEMIHVESEHSAISAALGAQATGVRTFTATASQGLALMHEMLFVVSGLRMPVVMAVANRALSAPINIWNDHQDSISQRDTGWIQLYVESAQEALDTIIMAYKIAEDKKVLLPVMVCLDGYTLSHVFEPVDIPEQKEVGKFLGDYKPHVMLNPSKPVSIGPIATPDVFMELKKSQQNAIENSVQAIKKTNNEFNRQFKRNYGNGLIETYRIEDAQIALIGMGTLCGTARIAIDELRKNKIKAGLIKIKSFRPFPKKMLQDTAKKIKKIAVIDRDISLGSEGALFADVKEALYGTNKKITGFIAGLGGRDITPSHIKKAFINAEKQKTEWLF